MLALDDPKWAEYNGAYGSASEIPGLLQELYSLPSAEGYEAEPYFSLWSALCHQGDVYTASYAAVPHLIAVALAKPGQVPWTVFLMVACIEIARKKGRGPAIPEPLNASYFEALAQAPQAVAASSVQPWDHWYSGAALALLAASQGHTDYAEAILELGPDEVKQVLAHINGDLELFT